MSAFDGNMQKRYKELAQMLLKKNEEKASITKKVSELLKNPPNLFGVIDALHQESANLSKEIIELEEEFNTIKTQLDK